MIKRYRLITNLGGDLKVNTTLVPDDEGGYVRYEDYMRIIDAIGAGGVKGRLMRKELSDEAVAEIKAMAAIQLVDGKAELTNVREIAHAIACRGSLC